MSDQFTSGTLYPDEATPPSPPVKTAALWEDFIDIFYAPSTVFARRERSGFAVPMLVVTVLVTLIFLATKGALQPVMDAEFSRGAAAAMKKNPQVTAAQMEQGRAIFEKFGPVVVLVTTPLSMLCIGVALWLVGKLVDARQTLGAAMMVTCYAFVPKIIGGLAVGAEGIFMDPSDMTGMARISLGVGRFLDPDTASPVLLALCTRLDIFTIWVTILLAIGLSVTGRISRGKAAVAGVIIWFVGALPPLLSALRS